MVDLSAIRSVVAPNVPGINRIPWAMQGRARACITRMATQYYSIVKHSFSMTKKESSNEDCIVVFLAEKFVQIVN